MDCPYCGTEMENGVLQGSGGRGIGWLAKPSTFPNRFNTEPLGINSWKYIYIPASRCPKCRKIILIY